MRLKFLLYLLFIIILSYPFITNITKTDYHNDEGGWITTSNLYFKLFFINRDYKNPMWSYSYYGFGRETPQLIKYIVGLSLWFNKHSNKYMYYFYDSKQTSAWNINNKRMPSLNVLISARIPSMIFGILACLVVFFTGKIVYNWQTGLLASVFLAYNPLMIESSCRAMVDSPALFFISAGILLLIIALNKNVVEKTFSLKHFVIYSFLGFMLGMGLSTKYSAGMFLLTALVISVINLFVQISSYHLQNKYKKSPVSPKTEETLVACKRSLHYSELRSDATMPYTYPEGKSTFADNLSTQILWKNQIINSVIMLSIMCIIAFFIFWVTNPFIYSHPLYKIKYILHFYKTFLGMTSQEQSIISQLINFKNAVILITKRLFIPVDDKYYGMLGKLLFLPIDVLFFSIGLISLVKIRKQKLGKNNFRPFAGSILQIEPNPLTIRVQVTNLNPQSEYALNLQFYILIWFTITVLGASKYIWVDWERYYLSFLPPVFLIISWGIVYFTTSILRFSQKFFHNITN